MSLHDTIQPSFTFLVGVALPYSVRSRLKKGATFSRLLGHTIWRSLILVALGIFLRSQGPMTNFAFTDTLGQIGLGYTFAFLLTFVRPRWQWTAFAGILFGYWLAWALYPAPGLTFNYAAVGVPAAWSNLFNYTGFMSHWNKNSNLGQAFDLWFLNLFPRPSRFMFAPGGYVTLNFIPTLGTMLLGVFAGRWFLSSEPKIPLRKFLIAAVALMAAGLLFHFAGVCPIVKRIWTPSWVLFSGGVCFAFLAAFSWVVDIRKHRSIAFPLVVVGMNSIAAYVMAGLCREFFENSFRIHLGWAMNVLGTALEPIVLGTLVLATYWVILFWMYRKKLFIRI
jgi:predicted acyltransferase